MTPGNGLERHALERGAQRTNDTNAIGDRPMKQTSGDRGRQTLNSGGRVPAGLEPIETTSRGTRRVSMKIVHVELKQANDFVAAHHRHHKPVQGHRFSLGLTEGDNLVGVVIVGRPVARNSPQTYVEVTRLCTNGTQNACSMLYGAAARAAKALGYNGIQTYILDNEPGTTLKAAGWQLSHMTQGRQWQHTDNKPRRTDQPNNDKQCWRKTW